jgi:DNA-binding response OmpR family regulator
MKVLVAEDNPVFQAMLAKLLTSWDYTVTVVPDGEPAWEILKDGNGPRLALVDWFIPGIDGLELCRRVRDLAAPPYTYILLLTGKDQPDDVAKGIESGADDYIRKPFNHRELEARVYRRPPDSECLEPQSPLTRGLLYNHFPALSEEL